MPVEITALSTADVQRRINSDPLEFYRQAADDMRQRGVEDAPTLTRVLEFVQPSEGNDSLDAYERLLQAAGIRTSSDFQSGYHASPATDFTENGPGNRMLFTEFFARTWRQVSYANRQQRAVLLSGDAVVGGWQRPYADAMTPRLSERVEPAIPLSELVAMTTPISGEDYRSFYLTYDADQLRMYRVGESAEIPIADITGSENTIRLKKYGRGLKASYEQLRRMRIDKLAWYIRLMAIQAEVDKVAAALAVLVAGDGNSNSVPVTWDLNGDFGGTLGTLDLASWIKYKLKFVQPYTLTTALMTEATALQLLMLNAGSANIPLASLNLGGMVQNLSPINSTSDNVRYGWTAEAPALTIVGFDRRFALEQVVEIGSSISEMDRFITNQTQVMTMTEVNGFAILDSGAIKLLDIND
jgi:hypothetical protein